LSFLKRRGGMPTGLPPETRIVLHVGCGPWDPRAVPARFRGPQWRELRYDIDRSVRPDIVGSIVDMSAVPDESVDAIFSSHNLEHVYAHEAMIVLREFLRVLRPGGELRITMPDLQHVAELIVTGKLEDRFYDGPEGALTPLDIVYGMGEWIAEGNEFMAHKTGFTASTLERKLRQTGFAEVEVERSRREIALWASARRPRGRDASREERSPARQRVTTGAPSRRRA
jgi:SAM-dependent methyltransferase